MNGLRETLWRALIRLLGRPPSQLIGKSRQAISPVQFYRILKAYYDSIGLYEVVGDDAPKPLRNPAFGVVEFYAQHLFPGTLPGALPIVTEDRANDRIKDPIAQVWRWSNWGAKKQVFARHQALYGDAFLKVVGSPVSSGPGLPGKGRVWFELLDPRFVTAFTEDERGYLIYLRIDKPQNPDGTHFKEPYTLTEVYSRETQDHRVWRHDKGAGASLKDLGDAQETSPLTDYGVNYIPAVHCVFQDPGDETNGGRGVGAFAPHLDLIDEHNRLVSRAHDMFFRYDRAVWALQANAGLDSSGRPVPAPRVEGNGLMAPGGRSRRSGDEYSRLPSGLLADTDTGALGSDPFVRLPGNSTLASLIPNVDYGAAHEFDDRMQKALERAMPELAYYRIRETAGDVSGRSVRLQLSDAIDRAVEARGNAETALIRAQQMALSQGQSLGLPGFSEGEIGTYRNGDFEHHFEEREVIPTNELEQAQTEATEVATLAAEVALFLQLGMDTEPLRRRLAKISSVDPERIEELVRNATPTAASSPTPPAPGGAALQQARLALSQTFGAPRPPSGG